MIVIGIPVGKNHSIDVRTAAYCSMEASRPDVKWGYSATRECGFGRSVIISKILEDKDVTHFYCLDSDVVPPTNTLQKLLDHDLPIVAGIYPQVIAGEPTWSFKIDNGKFEPKDRLPDKLFEATCIGGSTILIKREVLEKLPKPLFKVTYGDNNNYEHEDEYFSRIARDNGYKLMVDPKIICKHFNYGEL